MIKQFTLTVYAVEIDRNGVVSTNNGYHLLIILPKRGFWST